MRLLVVEEDDAFLAQLIPSLAAVSGLRTQVVRSRDSAIAALRAGFFDAVVLDLSLPSADLAMDRSVAHGGAVFAEARGACPRTPILFLTGSSAEPLYGDLLETKESVDLWGDRQPVATVQLWPKSKVLDFLAAVRSYARRIAATDAVELITDGLDLGLSFEDSRVLRVMAQRFGGAGARLAAMNSGRSGSRVLRMLVLDANGHERLRAIAKLSRDRAVRDETRRSHELHRLKPGDFAPFIGSVEGGARGVGATFYRLAEGYERNLFDVLAGSAEAAAALLPRVRSTLEPWLAAAQIQRTTVGDVRRCYLADDRAAELWSDFGLGDIEDIERRELLVRRSCTHGDLHAANVLVGLDDRPSLIDFGDVGDACSAVDPITLEFCLFSHPAGARRLSGWLPDFTAPWERTAQYAAAGPVAAFVIAARHWAREVAFSEHDLNANAYGYCLRQLKYPDTDKTFFARAVREMCGYLARL